MFQTLQAEINKSVIYAALRVGVQIHNENGQTHQHITLGGGSNDLTTNNAAQVDAEPQDPRAAGLGRNDPCYCGSGLKYKKCGLINSAEHQNNLV